jgi:1-deoxyxylulose-5-phosphate synthase
VRYLDFPGLGSLSQLVMGTVMVSPEKVDYSCELLDAYTALGGNVLDSAHIYGMGKSELAIGEWLRRRGNRERVFILTKGAHPDGRGERRVRPECIVEDLNESLERLGVETVDLYLLHRDNEEYPVGPIVECLNEQKQAGRIRKFGGSNWTHRRIQEANEYARAHGLEGFAASSPNLSLARPVRPRWPGCLSVDDEALAWYSQHRFPLFAWSSQAGGFFTGRFAPEVQDDREMVETYYTESNWERLRRAEELARRKGCTANQIALAWVLHQPLPVWPLIGPWSAAELANSVAALDVSLSPEECDWLDLRREAPPVAS